MRKGTIGMVVSLVFLVGCASNTSLNSGSSNLRKIYKLATGGTAGTYYPVGTALAEIWNKNVEDALFITVSSGGTVSNINHLKSDQVDVIFAQNDIAYDAVEGIGLFKDNAMADLRGLAVLYGQTCQFISRNDIGVHSLEDLKGKRIAVGSLGSSAEQNAYQILEASGLKYSDFDVLYINFSEAYSKLIDGTIDAALVTAGVPTLVVHDILGKGGFTILTLPNVVISKLVDKYPFYTSRIIEPSTYKELQEPIATVEVKAILATTKKMDAGVVQEMLKSMFDNEPYLERAHFVGRYIKRENALEGMSIPLHEGAIAFYKKLGLNSK